MLAYCATRVHEYGIHKYNNKYHERVDKFPDSSCRRMNSLEYGLSLREG